ncbi:hypothetical protein [Shewanella aquimarina]|uniref:hypothetical protein n=1 Tax=Shewanella aquimarina TaxID=260365 RepID=UPI0039F02822
MSWILAIELLAHAVVWLSYLTPRLGGQSIACGRPKCKHICDTLRAHPCELCLGIHASEGHKCVYTEFNRLFDLALIDAFQVLVLLVLEGVGDLASSQ